MKKFITLTENKEKVYVNVESIIMVLKNTTGETYLRLTHGHGILVSETIEEVMSMIEE